MGNVIVGVDESDGAAQALRWAVREGELHGWPVVAVLAWSYLDQHHADPEAPFDPDYGEADAEAALAEIVTAAVGPEAGAAVERRVVCDLPARALLEASAGAELLVVGARGLGGFRGLLLGSVSQQCLHHATSPVAVVRALPERPAGRERIVVGVDGSPTAREAVRWALDEGRARQGAVVAVHAWQEPAVGVFPYPTPPFDITGIEQAAREVVDAALVDQDLAGLPASVERVVTRGPAARVILDVASDADLVVVGSRGLGGFAGMLLGSVTAHVARHAPCPVVVLPPAATSPEADAAAEADAERASA